jgi:hypothetical protein
MSEKHRRPIDHSDRAGTIDLGDDAHGFAGLSFVGYRTSRKGASIAARSLSAVAPLEHPGGRIDADLLAHHTRHEKRDAPPVRRLWFHLWALAALGSAGPAPRPRR